MFRSLLVLMTVGFVGVAVASLVFSLLIPIMLIALKIALIVAVGYFVLRLVKPEMAENLRCKVRGKENG